MGQHTLDGTDITARREQYLRLVGERLPSAAERAADWPVQDDHCFARIVLDNVFEAPWYDHVDGRPAYEHLSAAELEDAIDIAEQMLDGGRPVVVELDENSLRWREEL